MVTIRRVKPWRRSPEQCYRVHGWRRWLMWWMFGPLLLVGLLLACSAGADADGGADGGAGAAGAVLMLVAATALAGWEWLWRRTTLELSATGLRLRQVGFTLEAAWSDVAGFHAECQHEGFVLAQPLRTASARRLGFFSGFTGLHAGDAADDWLADGRFIPIDAFAWHLRRGTLVADVSALAPHLAAQFAAAMIASNAPPAPATPEQRRRNVALSLLIGALAIISLALAWTQPAALARVVQVGTALAAPLVLLQAAYGTWCCIRSRQWGMALLMSMSTLLALGWCVVARGGD